MNQLRLAVLVTSFNRRDITVPNIQALEKALIAAQIHFKIFLVDDNSTDGTAIAVEKNIPATVVHITEGDYFWNKGMCCAYEIAKAFSNWDAYLLFNDDVSIFKDAVINSLIVFTGMDRQKHPILVGATQNMNSPEITYSGFNTLSRVFPRRAKRVFPGAKNTAVDMPNGNFLLVDSRFFESLGGLDKRYRHGYGDSDLGMVAKKRGCPALLLPEPVGRCPPNWSNKVRGGLFARIKSLGYPKTALSDYTHYCRKHFPLILLPFYILAFCARAIIP